MRIKSPSFLYGGVDDGGDIAFLDNPHVSYSKGLYFSLPSSGTKLFGSLVKKNKFWFSTLIGERNGMGMGYGWKDMRFFAYGFMKTKDDNLQQEHIKRRDNSVLYLGFEGKTNTLSFSSYMSITDKLLFSSVIKGGIVIKMMRVDFGYGRIQSLLKEEINWDRSLKLSIYNDIAEVSFSLLLSPGPIYLSTYGSLSFSSRGEMTLGKIKVESEAQRSFVKGRETLDASLTLSCGFWRIKLSRVSGLSLSFHFDSSSFTLSEKKIETKVILKKDEVKMTIEISGKINVEGKIEGKE